MKEKKESPLSRLMKLAGVHKNKYVLSVILACIGTVSGIVPYFAVSRIVAELLLGNREMNLYLVCTGIALAGYVCKVLFTTWSTSVAHRTTYKVLAEIRKKLLGKLSRLSMGDLGSTPSGSFKDTIVDRVGSLETTLAHMMPEFTSNLLVPVILLIYLLILDWRMALVTLVTIPIGMIFMMAVFKTYPTKYEGSVKASSDMNSAVVEYVNGIEVIKTFNQNARSYRKYSDAVVYDARYYYDWMKSCQLPMAANAVISPATLFGVLPVGFLFYAAGSLTAAEFITIIIVSLGVVGPLLAVMNFTDSLAIMGSVVDNVYQILETPELKRPEEDASLSGHTIEMKDVHFSYKETEVLHGISLTVPENTVTALVGPSGSGKSTIAKLIAGFWDVGSGTVSFGGKNIQEIPQKQLMENIAYISQDNFLFDDTVRENIRMGKASASDAEVEEAARKAGVYGFIMNLPQGFETKTGSLRGELSGGERQRIAIARAILKDAPVIIMDEATAYLDPENEALMQEAIGRLIKDKTLIIIAHRLSTVVNADNIVLIDEGKVTAQGTHDKLLQSSDQYRRMWEAHVGAKDADKEAAE